MANEDEKPQDDDSFFQEIDDLFGDSTDSPTAADIVNAPGQEGAAVELIGRDPDLGDDLNLDFLENEIVAPPPQAGPGSITATDEGPYYEALRAIFPQKAAVGLSDSPGRLFLENLLYDPKGTVASGLEMAGGIAPMFVGGPFGAAGKGMLASAGMSSLGEEAVRQMVTEPLGLREETSAFSGPAAQRLAENFGLNALFGAGGKLLVGNKAAERKLMQESGHLSTTLSNPSSSAAQRIARQERAAHEEFWRKAGISSGGTEFDEVTGKLIKPVGKVASSENIQAGLEKALHDPITGIRPKREVVLNSYDEAMKRFNLANPDKEISYIQLPDVVEHLGDSIENLDLFRKSGFTTDEAKAVEDTLSTLVSTMSIQKQSKLSPTGVVLTGYKEYTPKTINEQLSLTYEALRKLRKFDRSVAAKGAADPSVEATLEKTTGALMDIAGALKKARDQKLNEIFSKVSTAPQPEIKSLLNNKKLFPDTVQRLNDGYHHLSQFSEALQEWTDQRGRRVAAVANQRLEGSPNASLTKTEALKSMSLGTQRMFGAGPEARLAREPYEIVNYINRWEQAHKPPGALESLGSALQTPAGMVLGREMGGAALDVMGPQNAFAQEPMPRTPDAVRAQPLTIGRLLPPEMQGEFQKVLNGSDDDINRFMGNALVSIPGLAERFVPSNTAPDEFGGRFQDPMATFNLYNDVTSKVMRGELDPRQGYRQQLRVIQGKAPTGVR